MDAEFPLTNEQLQQAIDTIAERLLRTNASHHASTDFRAHYNALAALQARRGEVVSLPTPPSTGEATDER